MGAAATGEDGEVSEPHRIGRYIAEKALGAGSFATVWLAFDELLEVKVAIKVLADNWARNADVRRRFIDEAKILRRIDHDRIVRVHQVDELPDGRPYLVMALADRGTLHDRVTQLRESRQVMPVREAIDLTVEICESLAVVHDYGVVHRDIKPSNVLFRSVRNHERVAASRAGRPIGDMAVMLGDFGLAKDIAAASGFTLAAGTPAYMAPEQARASNVIDKRVDVFATTAVLFELLTGAPAFASDTLSGVRRSRTDSRIPNIVDLRAELDPAFQRIIEKGLANDPDGRYSSTIRLAEELLDLRDGAKRTVRIVMPTPAGESVVSGAPPLPPPSSKPSLQPVGAAGRVKDLLAVARTAEFSPAGVELVAEADRRLVRPLTVGVLDADNPDIAHVPWALLGLRPSLALLDAAARIPARIRLGKPNGATVGNVGGERHPLLVSVAGGKDVDITVPVDGPPITDLDITVDAPGRMDVVVHTLPALRDDSVLPECDVVVVLVSTATPEPAGLLAELATSLRAALAGPIAIEVLVWSPDPLSAPEPLAEALSAGSGIGSSAEALSLRSIGRVRAMVDELADTRGALVRAAAGLRLLARAADEAAPGRARIELVESIDELNTELPMLAEIEVLRDIASGRVAIPRRLRMDLRRLFLHADASLRLGLARSADESQLRAAVEAMSNDLRVQENTGKVPFTARKAVLLAQQSLDRLHAEIAPYA